MSLPVRLTPRARADFERLPAFLQLESPRAADRARAAIMAGLATLTDFPNRGRPTSDPDIRELPVRFGRYGYALRYQVRSSEILVLRIRHVREGA